MIGGGGRIWGGRIWAGRIWTKVGAQPPSVLTVTLEAYLSGAWVNITPDVHAATRIRLKYGIDGNGPLDNVAGPGECTFALNNSAKAGRLLGSYSPLNANVRAGWTWGVPIRLTLFDPLSATPTVKHLGKAHVIEPTANLHGERLVHVVSYDGMYDLMEADTRELGIALDQTEFQLMQLVLDAAPSTALPASVIFDAGVDTFSYAFYDTGGGRKALELIKDIAVDSNAFVFMKGNGALIGRNRHTRVDGASAVTLTDASLRGFSAPSTLDQAYNVVRVTIHPPTIDETPSVLYSDQVVRSVLPGQTMVFWATYSDPEATTDVLIGGLDVNSMAFTSNDQADGLGTNLNAYLGVVLESFGSTARVTVTNNHSTATAYFVDGAGAPYLQILGRGVHDRGPQTYEASSVQPYGTRQLDADLRYQDDPQVAQHWAEFVEAQRRTLSNQPQSSTFTVKTPSALMTHAVAREPGDIITVSETMTGFASVDAVIQSVELEIMPGPIVTCTWGLAPAAPFAMWELDITGLSELDDTTILGF